MVVGFFMVLKFCPVDPKDTRVDVLSGHVFSNVGILLLIKRSFFFKNAQIL